MRDENLKRRGIDPDDNEGQVKEIEARGRQILSDYKEQKDTASRSIDDAEAVLEPVQNSLQQLGVALGKHSLQNICTFMHIKRRS